MRNEALQISGEEWVFCKLPLWKKMGSLSFIISNNNNNSLLNKNLNKNKTLRLCEENKERSLFWSNEEFIKQGTKLRTYRTQLVKLTMAKLNTSLY